MVENSKGQPIPMRVRVIGSFLLGVGALAAGWIVLGGGGEAVDAWLESPDRCRAMLWLGRLAAFGGVLILVWGRRAPLKSGVALPVWFIFGLVGWCIVLALVNCALWCIPVF